MSNNEIVAVLCQALEAIDDLEGEINGYRTSDFPIPEKAKASLRQAIAEAKRQEPFCFFYVENGEEFFAPKGAYVPDNAQPLYTHPQPKESATHY